MDILAYSIRVVIIFVLVYFGARILSKKAIAEMTAYEIAGIFILSNVAAEPLVTQVTTKALFGTGLLVALIILTSRLALVDKLTPILEHTPTVVVANGQVDTGALRNVTLSLNELYGLLRQKGYDKVSDVEFAVLEPQGNLSVIPKSQKRPVRPEDLNMPTQYEGLTLPLIMDGAIIERNLRHAQLSEAWLTGELKKQGINDYSREVGLAELDTQGDLRVSLKEERPGL